MNEERSRILEMLAQGKINVAEAERLLDAVSPSREAGETGAVSTPAAANGRKPKFLRVVVEDGEDKVNVRVPLAILRAGMRFASVIPESARDKISSELKDKGVDLDFSNLKPEAIEDLVIALGDLSVEVNGSDGEHVRVFCE